jgi:hypothetical protein
MGKSLGGDVGLFVLLNESRSLLSELSALAIFIYFDNPDT